MTHKSTESKILKGRIKHAKQLIRFRNIMMGLPILYMCNPTINNDIPFGYEHDSDREGWLRPVQKQLEALYWARTLVKRATMEELAAWITQETGRTLTRRAWQSIIYTRPPLSVYLLPLNERIQIATSETEETAIAKAPVGIQWTLRKRIKERTEYTQARRKVKSGTSEVKELKTS